MQAQTMEENVRLPLTIFMTVILFATLAHMMADMYVPSLPAIRQSLHSTPAVIQLTLFAFLLGYSLAHLVYGPISDRVGRRTPMLTGIGLSMVGTLFCFFAPTAAVLICGRFIQGIGVAVCNSVGRSLVRDMLAGSHLAKVSSHLGMVMVFVLATAPTVGGYIQYYFNWQAVFLVLLVYTGFIWLVTWRFLPETSVHLNPHATKLKVMLRNYGLLLTHKSFIGYSLCVSFAYAGMIAYVTSAPFLFQDVIGLNAAQYGWLSFVVGAAVFCSFFINSQFVVKLGIEKMMMTSISLMLCGGLSMLILAMLGLINVYAIMLPIALYCVGAGLTFSNAFAGAVHPFPKMAGAAGAMYGCLQILGGAAASALMAALQVNNQLPLATVLFSLGLLSFLSFRFLAQNNYKNKISLRLP